MEKRAVVLEDGTGADVAFADDELEAAVPRARRTGHVATDCPARRAENSGVSWSSNSDLQFYGDQAADDAATNPPAVPRSAGALFADAEKLASGCPACAAQGLVLRLPRRETSEHWPKRCTKRRRCTATTS